MLATDREQAAPKARLCRGCALSAIPWWRAAFLTAPHAGIQDSRRGEVWTRPGLDYRTRRILVLGTMLAIGRWEEFRLHLRAALADGFSLAEVKELMLQQAIYCGIPVVNTGFHHVDAVVKELASQGVKIDIG
jgi:alkylhydroperoxidase/carboxymuconolactone decarboxylase family protein YurZ